MSGTRFAAYLRVSTTDKQDPALSFPSQLKACERKVTELGGQVTVTFQDQESGAKQVLGEAQIRVTSRNQTSLNSRTVPGGPL